MNHELDDQWWKPFYDDAAMRVLASKPAGQVNAEVDTILNIARLNGIAEILDQCCGLGQHAIELSSRGHSVVGIDQASIYIDRATENANRLLPSDAAIRFETHDARNHHHLFGVDLIYNWHSSFGYFTSETENRRMIDMAYHSLRSGGQFLLEYPNVFHLIAHFRPVMKSEVDLGLHLTRTSKISPAQSVMHQEWRYDFADGQQRIHHSRLHLYLPDQLRSMFETIGFRSIEIRSGDGGELTLASPRCVIVGTKR